MKDKFAAAIDVSKNIVINLVTNMLVHIIKKLFVMIKTLKQGLVSVSGIASFFRGIGITD